LAEGNKINNLVVLSVFLETLPLLPLSPFQLEFSLAPQMTTHSFGLLGYDILSLDKYKLRSVHAVDNLACEELIGAINEPKETCFRAGAQSNWQVRRMHGAHNSLTLAFLVILQGIYGIGVPRAGRTAQ
jgi:hypothetical protein